MSSNRGGSRFALLHGFEHGPNATAPVRYRFSISRIGTQLRVELSSSRFSRLRSRTGHPGFGLPDGPQTTGPGCSCPRVRAVVSVGNGVEHSFPHGLLGILRHIAAEKPVDQAALADARQHVVNGLGHHLGNRPFELPIVEELLTPPPARLANADIVS